MYCQLYDNTPFEQLIPLLDAYYRTGYIIFIYGSDGTDTKLVRS